MHFLKLVALLWAVGLAALAMCGVFNWHPRIPLLGRWEPRTWPTQVWAWVAGLWLALCILLAAGVAAYVAWPVVTSAFLVGCLVVVGSLYAAAAWLNRPWPRG